MMTNKTHLLLAVISNTTATVVSVSTPASFHAQVLPNPTCKAKGTARSRACRHVCTCVVSCANACVCAILHLLRSCLFPEHPSVKVAHARQGAGSQACMNQCLARPVDLTHTLSDGQGTPFCCFNIHPAWQTSHASTHTRTHTHLRTHTCAHTHTPQCLLY
jgi:hypothetical protein